MQNEMNKILNQKEFTQFGNSKMWDLEEFAPYKEGYNDEGWNKYENNYQENTLAWWLYNAGNYDSVTNR